MRSGEVTFVQIYAEPQLLDVRWSARYDAATDTLTDGQWSSVEYDGTDGAGGTFCAARTTEGEMRNRRQPDAGEEPAAAALRECEEETGYRPAHVEPLPGFYPTNGISAHYTHLFVGHDCAHVGAPTPDAAEQLLARVFTRGEVEALLDAGKLADGFTAIAVMYWLRGLGAR